MNGQERLAEIVAHGQASATLAEQMRDELHAIIRDPLHAQAAGEVVTSFDAVTSALGHLNEAIRPLLLLAGRVENANGHADAKRVDVTATRALH